MKNTLYVLVCVLLISCSPEAIEDCVRGNGDLKNKTVEIDAFDKITIRPNIALYITYAEEQSLTIEAGEYILENMELNLVDGHLELVGQDLCASGSEIPPYTVYLETPHLTQIRNSSQFEVKSTNTLAFEELLLISENYNDDEALAVGDFRLDIDASKLEITHAGLSDFYVSGTCQQLSIGIFSGTGRIFAKELVAQRVGIYHRGFADVQVFPIEVVEGTLASTGNLLLYHQASTINVERLFEGQLIFLF